MVAIEVVLDGLRHGLGELHKALDEVWIHGRKALSLEQSDERLRGLDVVLVMSEHGGDGTSELPGADAAVQREDGKAHIGLGRNGGGSRRFILLSLSLSLRRRSKAEASEEAR